MGHSLRMCFMPASHDVGNGPESKRSSVERTGHLHRAITNADLNLITLKPLHSVTRPSDESGRTTRCSRVQGTLELQRRNQPQMFAQSLRFLSITRDFLLAALHNIVGLFARKSAPNVYSNIKASKSWATSAQETPFSQPSCHPVWTGMGGGQSIWIVCCAHISPRTLPKRSRKNSAANCLIERSHCTAAHRRARRSIHNRES
jgi:hypothetical protein